MVINHDNKVSHNYHDCRKFPMTSIKTPMSAPCSRHFIFALDDNWAKNFSSEIDFNPHLLHSFMLHFLNT